MILQPKPSILHGIREQFCPWHISVHSCSPEKSVTKPLPHTEKGKQLLELEPTFCWNTEQKSHCVHSQSRHTIIAFLTINSFNPSSIHHLHHTSTSCPTSLSQLPLRLFEETLAFIFFQLFYILFLEFLPLQGTQLSSQLSKGPCFLPKSNPPTQTFLPISQHLFSPNLYAD